MWTLVRQTTLAPITHLFQQNAGSFRTAANFLNRLLLLGNELQAVETPRQDSLEVQELPPQHTGGGSTEEEIR